MNTAMTYPLALIMIGMGSPFTCQRLPTTNQSATRHESVIKLPTPKYGSQTSIEQALRLRRSVREYKGQPSTLADE